MKTLQAAVEALRTYVGIEKTSPVYETSAAYVKDQPAFLNAVLTGTTKLTAFTLLRVIKKIEMELGRVPTFRFGPRLIDIDIIFYGDEIIASPELTVPHKHMAEREFVLRPLADIVPDWKHPQTSLSVAEMLALVPTENPTNLGALT